MIGSRNKIKAGDSFNGIVFIKDIATVKRSGNMRRIALFRCHCGREKAFLVNDIIRGHTKSCGCFRTKSNTKHGHSVGGNISSEYSCWRNIIRRCTNAKSHAYKNYGGRGIKVCDRWLERFENFFEDMGYKPSSLHSIERDNVNGDYTPENCRWATKAEQMRNTRRNVKIEYKSIVKTISEWSLFLNIDKSTIAYRLRRNLPLELVFFNGGLQKNKLLTNDGKLKGLAKSKQ